MSSLIVNANALNIPLATGTVQTVVTSPPYFGLRDYNVTGQLGLERTPEEYVANLVAVFREVRRVLREDGCIWVNLDDSYANSNPGSGGKCKLIGAGKAMTEARYTNITRDVSSLKPKDLIGIPWRVAFALQADGWYLRSDIIWSKPNPMPESVTDRPTKSFEHVFLLSKSEKYFYDAEAVREQGSGSDNRVGFRGGNGRLYTHNNTFSNSSEGVSQSRVVERPNGDNKRVTLRNLRDVWTIATQPTKDAHFATYPEKLVEPCILAGTSARGCCPKCRAPWVRETKAEGGTIGRSWNDHKQDSEKGQRAENAAKGGNGYRIIDLGFHATCTCNAGEPVPCLVLDPFSGSGTTGRVALRLGRRYVGLELSMTYISEISVRRLQTQIGMGL